jgi:hypothetical protein
MTPEQLRVLREMREQVMSGAWRSTGPEVHSEHGLLVAVARAPQGYGVDAAYIAALHNAAPELFAAVEENERLQITVLEADASLTAALDREADAIARAQAAERTLGNIASFAECPAQTDVSTLTRLAAHAITEAK